MRFKFYIYCGLIVSIIAGVFLVTKNSGEPVFPCQKIIPENLFPGDSGPAVLELQRFLNSDPDTQIMSGVGSPGQESGFFGPKTENAVIKFQEKYADEILQPAGISRGTGIVGMHTRSKIEKLCAGSVVPHAETGKINSEVLNKISRTYFGGGSFWLFLAALVLTWGFNFIFWGFISLIRSISEKIRKDRYKRQPARDNEISMGEVAALVPAHNEELVIEDTLFYLSKLVKPINIFVVSDGSKDRTGQIAASYGVNVLELNPGKGKAGALQECIRHFKIEKHYKAVVLVDADTRLKRDYFQKALPHFNNPEIVAVAGYASTIWNPGNLSWKQKLFLLHRERVYFLSQRLIKFGQTWKYTSVTPIVPGFASIYRASILKDVDMNPPGLVIEDFNMTFEVHHKTLGKIAHHPDIVAYTQDPDNGRDYFRQVKRWHLGFWQTIRFHGFWPSKFWVAMSFTLTEVVLGSLAFLTLPMLLIISLIPPDALFLSEWPDFLRWQNLILGFFIAIWLSDYLLTVAVAFFQKRREYLLVGMLFPVIRVLDAWAFLSGIPKAFMVKSNGQWVSPTRRSN